MEMDGMMITILTQIFIAYITVSPSSVYLYCVHINN